MSARNKFMDRCEVAVLLPGGWLFLIRIFVKTTFFFFFQVVFLNSSCRSGIMNGCVWLRSAAAVKIMCAVKANLLM